MGGGYSCRASEWVVGTVVGLVVGGGYSCRHLIINPHPPTQLKRALVRDLGAVRSTSD